MNLLAELSSAGVFASLPASAGGRGGNAPAPAQSPFADVLGSARGGHSGPADHGTGTVERAASDPELTIAEEQLHGTVGGESGEIAAAYPVALLLPLESAPPAAADGARQLPEGSADRFTGLPGARGNGHSLPPGLPHGGKPLPPQAPALENPGPQPDPRQAASAGLPATAATAATVPAAGPGAALVAALRPEGAQSLSVSAAVGMANEQTTAQHLPSGLERAGEAGKVLRSLTGAEVVPEVAVMVRPGAMPPVESGAAVFDPRAILEVNARQHRTPSNHTAALEALDRTAPGLESADQANRPLVARPVTPTLLTRDLSALAERVETLAQRPGGVASVSVSLGDLGNVEISVRMEARQAHVQFVVQDAMAREALESQLPRLRAMLEESGLRLGDVNTGLPGKSERDSGGERPHAQTDATPTPYDDRELPADDRPDHGPSAPGSHLLDAFA